MRGSRIAPGGSRSSSNLGAVSDWRVDAELAGGDTDLSEESLAVRGAATVPVAVAYVEAP